MRFSDLVKDYLSGADEETLALFSRLAELIAYAHPGITAAVKWRKLTFALDGSYHYWLCALARVKKGIALYFHFGSLLDDPHAILRAGAGEWMRKIEITAWDPLYSEAIPALVRQAAEKRDAFIRAWQKQRGAA